MVKTKIGYTESGFGDEIFKIENRVPIEFLCEHCGELRRKVFYSESGGINWCKLCFSTLNVVKNKPILKFKPGDNVKYKNSWDEYINSTIKEYLSKHSVIINVKQSDGSILELEMDEKDLESC